MEWLWWFVLPGALLAGLFLFYLFVRIQTGELDRESRLSNLTKRHHNVSHIENEERIRLIRYMGKENRGSTEHRRLCDVYEKIAVEHQDAWNARVQEMIAIEFPIDDATMAELDAGINPYRKRGG